MKKLQRTKTNDEESKFWSTEKPFDFMGEKDLRLTVFFNLRPTSRTISIRLPESLLGAVKGFDDGTDLPYLSMLRQLLSEAVKEEPVTSKRRVAAG